MKQNLFAALLGLAVLCLPACRKSNEQSKAEPQAVAAEQVFCQSCGMPMASPESFGTNADGTLSADYCAYCYQDGAFLQDLTMDEMIAHCAQFVEEFNKDAEHKISQEEAIAQMRIYFPTLKRWRVGDE